jgi:transcriptional regulator with XRE-family HTH domain
MSFEAKVDRAYVSQLENGHKSPTVDVLFRICPVLGMAPSELIAQVERDLQTRRK